MICCVFMERTETSGAHGWIFCILQIDVHTNKFVYNVIFNLALMTILTTEENDTMIYIKKK